MLQFKSQADLAQLPPDDPAYEIVKQQIAYLISAYDSPDHPYIAEDYGWIDQPEYNFLGNKNMNYVLTTQYHQAPEILHTHRQLVSDLQAI